MATVNEYKTRITPIPSFALQRRDWKPLALWIANSGDIFDDVLHELRTLIRVSPPPANTDNVTVTTLTVGLLTRIFERFYPWGEISDNGRTRFKVAVAAAELTIPDLAGLIAAIDAERQAVIDDWEDKGNKRLIKRA